MPEPDVALSISQTPQSDPTAAPVTESPDRRAPILQMPNGELPRDIGSAPDAPFERASTLQRFARDAGAETAREDRVRTPGDSPSVSAEHGAPSIQPDLTFERAQRQRRVQEFANDTSGERKIREWDGAEHEGTVVAADAESIVMHIGLHEFMRIPFVSHLGVEQMVGLFTAVDRAGRIVDQDRDSTHRSLRLERGR